MGQAGSKQEMFWEACGFGRAHLVEKFIEHGIDINWVSDIHACSPIHVASQGKADVVKLLIDAGCDLTVQDSRGNTAVHHAAMKGEREIIQMLVDAGADINAQEKSGWSPLHCAAYYAHLGAAESLVKNGCDVNVLNKDGRSALVETARSRSVEEEQKLGEVAQLLIKAGADVNLKCADLGEANFTALMFSAYHNHVEVAAALIDGHCDLNSVSAYTMWTALHWAADRGNHEMIYLLLEAGADPTCTGMRGELASDRVKDPEIRQFLEEATRIHREVEQVETASLSSTHSVNAQASLDTARALENLSTHAKNRDILSAPMPSIPALGISSRGDPKTRYVKRDVQEVAKAVSAVFPWRSFSKQGTPSPDKDADQNGEGGGGGGGEERRKMFPSQDDKTNAFMDNLAERIFSMTSRIASMSSEANASASGVNGKRKDAQQTPNSAAELATTPSAECADNSLDSGLSTREGSRLPSELNSPQDGLVKMRGPTSPGSDSASSSKHSSPVKSPSRNGDILDAEADSELIEENHRGFAILRALQERHRRSLCMDEINVSEGVKGAPADTPGSSHIMSQV